MLSVFIDKISFDVDGDGLPIAGFTDAVGVAEFFDSSVDKCVLADVTDNFISGKLVLADDELNLFSLNVPLKLSSPKLSCVFVCFPAKLSVVLFFCSCRAVSIKGDLIPR